MSAFEDRIYDLEAKFMNMDYNVESLQDQTTNLREELNELKERVDLITKILHTVDYNISALVIITERLEKEKLDKKK